MTVASDRGQRAAVNVDVDGLYLYDRIHGYQGGSGNDTGFDPAQANPVAWTSGVTRFLDLFDRAGVKATFFVVAQDLAHPDARAVLKEVVAAGHEVGNHSFTHPYDLSRWQHDAICDELRKAREALEDFCGSPVSGFRAPGYVLSDALREAIVDTGHVYSSSRFPCPPYQAAKAMVIGAYQLVGRPSGSIPEAPATWFSGLQPALETLPSGRALWELPIGVVPGIRMPFIGTSVIAFGSFGQSLLGPLLQRASWLNFECHAFDLTDHERDKIPDRLAMQPDQRVPLRKKWPLFVKVLEQLQTRHEVKTLASWQQSAAA